MPPQEREPEQPVPLSEPYVPPPAQESPERIRQQRIGEALLSDGGRISDTSQAKTIAIEALARRMRSSTGQLVSAAIGLKVGTDMAERLGDHRYVLVPHNERYPSIGADVLHVDELDPERPEHAPDRVVRMDQPEADTLVRQISVSEIMGAWAYGSNNNVRVFAIQEATQEEFGLTQALDWNLDAQTRKDVDIELACNRHTLRDFVRTQYEMTQEVLAERGISELIGYRAMSWQEGAPRPDWLGLNVGDGFQARHRPLASWSADRQIVADWLETRGAPGAILVDRTPARDVLSVPTTGMGYFAQMEWVALPGDRPSTLDGVYLGRSQQLAAEQTAASSVNVGAPALDGETPTLPNSSVEDPAGQDPGSGSRWQPIEITGRLDPADPLDSRMIRVLDGEEPYPDWWPRDDSGYAVTKRDLEFLGINPVQIKWLAKREAPMGMTPELYEQFGTEMLEALRQDGVDPSAVDIRLKGTGAGFFSGMHKTLPREEELPDNPEAAQRLQEWFGDSRDRPLRRPHDAMWRLGLESVPSDFDLDINSTPMIRVARQHWREQHSDRYPGDFMGGHGYLDKQAVKGAFPSLAEWSNKWEKKLGRELSLGAFESSGPINATKLGRTISGHFRDSDWIIHNTDNPWHTTAAPRRQMEADAGGQGPDRALADRVIVNSLLAERGHREASRFEMLAYGMSPEEVDTAISKWKALGKPETAREREARPGAAQTTLEAAQERVQEPTATPEPAREARRPTARPENAPEPSRESPTPSASREKAPEHHQGTGDQTAARTSSAIWGTPQPRLESMAAHRTEWALYDDLHGYGRRPRTLTVRTPSQAPGHYEALLHPKTGAAYERDQRQAESGDRGYGE
ncbi:hypothetical protein MRI28_17680 [Nocardiopsis dassonvillei]|uniref:hypothetical protein n=1 Tax=Nocardiopsis dassonvillei TaxID=2014 RepID=UPI00200DAFD5|nr:hypothetical protein [Nocardiopsis dassonvillei]MCK9871446.1 hypothetical protein [Nocardiopsis dassonvillei]